MGSLFRYIAIDHSGKEIKGTIDGSSISDVIDKLLRTGIEIIEINPAGMLGRIINMTKHRASSGRINRKALIEFSLNLSTFIKAGIPLLTALRDISESFDNPKLKNAVNEVIEQVEAGSPLWEAFSKDKKAFPRIFPTLIKIGEETGQLEKILTNITSHLKRIDDIQGNVKKALIYPIFVMTSSVGALFFWFIFVMPKMAALFRDMNITLPPITRALLWTGDALQSSWHVIIIALIIAVISPKVLPKIAGPRAKFFMDCLKLKLPILKSIIYNSQLAFISEYMGILLKAGIPIDKILSIVNETISNTVFKKAIMEVVEDISYGTTMHQSFMNRLFLNQHLFPGIFLRMIKIGEDTGNLDGNLDFLADYYHKVIEDISQKMGKMLEPIIMASVGLIFAIIFIGLLLPVYDLISNVTVVK